MTDPVQIAEELAPGPAARAADHDVDAAFPADVADMVAGTDTRPW